MSTLLRRMGAPARLVRLVEGMYADMRTTYEVDGVPVVELPVSSGIR